ncbi:MAG: hypothetical protein HYT76_08480 [Deltaproteobacteria bacterium]|nr:hypothetical protein [Deltaproteobacteria bacterium]
MQNRAILHVRKLQKEVDKICKKYPNLERSDVYHTLILLEKPPLERLKMALTRAQNKAALPVLELALKTIRSKKS